MFTRAIVRRPARSLQSALSAHPELGPPDLDRAFRQHDVYIKALESAGLVVEVLPAMDDFPDSCFVEDVAVCARSFALIARPGAPSRQGEESAIREALSRHFRIIEGLSEPGTLEGGDVMAVGNAFHIGLSARTNAEGARQLLAALERHGQGGVIEPVPKDILHLKTGMSYLDDGIVVCLDAFKDRPSMAGLRRVPVPPDEARGANCLRINDTVLVPSGCPKVAAGVKAAGLKVVELDIGEFHKIDGGLSCLSLRF
ncbi:MAG: N(G),N(G)-dimethylarginine dimethylaminohydrolase [Spirochaetales bacterium]|nr:N(G),N(G)-dimethylarginine dimethylaminohydrolase [Spirochaetales bacterium]